MEVLHKPLRQVQVKEGRLEAVEEHFQKDFIPHQICHHQNLLTLRQGVRELYFNSLKVKQVEIHHLVQVQHYWLRMEEVVVQVTLSHKLPAEVVEEVPHLWDWAEQMQPPVG